MIWPFSLFERKPNARLPARRTYEAAKPARIANFAMASLRSANQEVRWSLKGLIQHSRQQAQNNDYLKSYLGMVRRNLVGPKGVRLRNEARDPSGELDKGANALVETGWKEWGKRGNCSLDGRMNWLRLCWVIAETVARDGNVLVRLYRGRQYGPFGFQLQLLEIDHLDFDKNEELPGGRRIVMGIEIDADGRRLAYHLFVNHPGDVTYSTSHAGERIRVPAADILHVFREERPGQMAGVPWAYTALRRLNMIRGYEEAAITAARTGAAKMGFYQRSEPEDGPIAPADVEKTEQGHIVTEVEPGLLEELPQGVTFQGWDPAYPTGEMAPFMKTMLRGAAAGLAVSYNGLANDLEGVNFSSMRAGLGEERDEWRVLQQVFVDALVDPVFKAFLPMALLTQAVPLPMAKIDKFDQPSWRPRGWAYVSPGEEAAANQREMSGLIRSPQQIVAERGEDLEDVFEQIADAKKLAESYGLKFDPKPPGHENEAQPAAEPAKP